MHPTTYRRWPAWLWEAALLLPPLLLTACNGASSSEGIEVWATGPDRHVFGDTKPVFADGVWTPRQDKITLTGAINETVSFQVVLRGSGRSIEGVRVEIPPPFGTSHTFPATAIRRYRQWYVPISRLSGWFIRSDMVLPRATEYPDALIPLDAPKLGEPFALPADLNVPIWVDIHVAAGTEPGLYTSSVNVIERGGLRASVPLELTVWPFALPELPEISVLVGVDHKPLFAAHLRRDGEPHVPERLSAQDPLYEEAKMLLDQTMQLFKDHRCSPFLGRLHPTLKSTRPGTVELDWTDYDRIVTGYLDGSAFSQGTPVEVWPLPVDDTFPPPPAFGGLHSATYAGTLKSHLQACLAHFEEKGWLDRHFVWIPVVSDSSAAGYAAAKHFGRIVQYSDKRLNYLTTMIPRDMAPLGWHDFQFTDFSELVSIWAPRGQFYFPRQMDRQRALGKRTWIRPGFPPFSSSLSLESPPWQSAGLVWQASRMRAEAVLIEHANDWPADPLGVEQNSDRPTNQWLIYPGTLCGLNHPIPSIRLKQLRRGVEDMAYRGLLGRHHIPHIADRIIANLVRVACADASDQHFAEGVLHAWADDPALWAAGRRLMGTELARLSIPAGEAQDQPPTQSIQKSVEWLQFFQKTENVFVDVAPARIRMAEPAHPGELEVEFPITIANYRNEPVSGTLRLPNASDESGEADLPVETIPPFGRIRTTIRARYPGFGTNENGVTYETIEFNSPQVGKISVPARIALVGARPIRKKPIVVDGDLADWPKAWSNVASDFLLAGRNPEAKGLGDHRKPTQPTQAFVCRDHEYLYFAFNCFEERPEQLSARQSNFVVYDGLTPVGEDLIEIMIDPSNSGTTRTSDLYHIAIKPTGTEVCEVGIATSPATAEHRFWPADVRIGPVRRHENRWVVELRVPLAAFPPNALTKPVWGFNVARYQARLGEYTSWSGATRHFYSPQTMGNLLMLSP